MWFSLIVGPIGIVAASFMEYQRRHADKVIMVEKVLGANEQRSASTTQEVNEKEKY